MILYSNDCQAQSILLCFEGGMTWCVKIAKKLSRSNRKMKLFECSTAMRKKKMTNDNC